MKRECALLRLKSLVLFGCFLVFLHGCGGGGGGGGGDSKAPNPNAPAILLQPTSIVVNAGGTARFSSNASPASVSIQWYRDGVSIPNANGWEYSLERVQMSDSGAIFTVVFSNSLGSVTSNRAKLTVTMPPLVHTQPEDAVVDQGDVAVFTVGTASGLDLAFQWQRSNDVGVSWTDIPDATQPTFTTGTVGLMDHGPLFRVRVSSGSVQTFSDAAFLRVQPKFAVAAGKPGGCGYFDGRGDTVRLCSPSGVAFDPAGNMFVLEPLNNSVRKVAFDGNVSTFARLYRSNPSLGRMVADAAGNLYVALPNDSVVSKIQPDGTQVEIAGSSQQGLVDGVGAAAQFIWPHGLAIDVGGNLYVSDTRNGTIRKITPAGEVTTLAGAPGSPTAGVFDEPEGLAVAPNGDLIIADSRNHVVRRLTPAGVVSVVAGNVGVGDFVDGSSGVARFYWPADVAVDATGIIYVADANNHAIRRIATNGVVTTLAGDGSPGAVDGSGSAARLNRPTALTFDGAGNLFIAERDGHAVRRLTPGGQLITVAGVPLAVGTNNGAGPTARFSNPSVAAVGPDGSAYILDGGAVRVIDPQGMVSTFAGQPDVGGYINGSAAGARFESPYGMAVAANGDVFIAEVSNCEIRRISGGVVTSFAGLRNNCGFVDGQGSAARFYYPSHLAIAPNGDLLVSDSAAVRRITPAGVVSTVAGRNNGTWSSEMTDGTVAAARFSRVRALAAIGDAIYVVDSDARVRMIEGGEVSTIYVHADSFYYAISALTAHAGKLYLATYNGEVGMLYPPSGLRIATFVPMLASGSATVRLGANSLVNAPKGLAFTNDGKMLIVSENAVLISE